MAESPIRSPSPDDTALMGLSLKRSASSLMSNGSNKRSTPDMIANKSIVIPKLPTDITFPPLPTIDNSIIERQVFTHSSVYGQSRTVSYSEGEGELLDNEKLEWVGDGILKAICTRLLHRLWPSMREGPTTVIMSHLVSNKVLAQIIRRYDLMQRIHASASSRMSVQASEANQANLFESYIAGLFQSLVEPHFTRQGSSLPSPPPTPSKEATNGQEAVTEGQAYDEVSAWLVPLFTPIAHFIREHLQAEQQRQNGDKGSDVDYIDPNSVVGSSARLNELFIGRLRTGLPDYRHSQVDNSLMWKTTCTVTLPGGDQVTAETIQTGKQAGKQVVAYKLLVQLGMLNEENV